MNRAERRKWDKGAGKKRAYSALDLKSKKVSTLYDRMISNQYVCGISFALLLIFTASILFYIARMSAVICD